MGPSKQQRVTKRMHGKRLNKNILYFILYNYIVSILFKVPNHMNYDVFLGTNRTYFDAKTRLVKYLTNNSELMKEILPAHDINTPVDVNVKIYLRQITIVVSMATRIYFYLNNALLSCIMMKRIAS